ncbi:MAG: aldo/keto reductase [Deltaproteobacteria bacterium]|nr:aldo/keto reductase [Deltaproteobacteria bacterium]
MNQKNDKWSRRDFLKATGTAGLGAVMAPIGQIANATEIQNKVPVRSFGKTGVKVSILSLGGMFDIASNQIMLKQAVRWGVTYWDTADCYQRGSETGIGKYFKKYPKERNSIFLVTKSDARNPKGMTRLLNRSMKKMNTNYIDLYFVHGISDIDELDEQTRTWAEKAKAEGKIRLFGFSTHRNMETCMLEAAKLGWIDGIMMTYNFRLMHTDRMKRAIDACVKAGIGMTAMKTQGGGSVKTNTDTELKMAGRFLQKGFTDAQAKLMSVWQNPNISSICSQMPNMTILKANVAAALNRTDLSVRDTDFMHRYAWETHSDYCAGCTKICESNVEMDVPIGDVMRYLMYFHSYNEFDYAAAQFKTIPKNIRLQMVNLDYSLAEQRCPQQMAIGKLMREAVNELS